MDKLPKETKCACLWPDRTAVRVEAGGQEYVVLSGETYQVGLVEALGTRILPSLAATECTGSHPLGKEELLVLLWLSAWN